MAQVFKPEVKVKVGSEGAPLWEALGGEAFEAALGDALTAAVTNPEAGLAAVAAAVAQAAARWDGLDSTGKWARAVLAKKTLPGIIRSLDPRGNIVDIVGQIELGEDSEELEEMVASGSQRADNGVRDFLRDIQRVYGTMAQKLSGASAPAGVMAHATARVMGEFSQTVSYGPDISITFIIKPLSLSGREATATAQTRKFIRTSDTSRALGLAAAAAKSPELRTGLLAAQKSYDAAMSPSASPELRGAADAAGHKLVKITDTLRVMSHRLSPRQHKALSGVINALRGGTLDPDALGTAAAELDDMKTQLKGNTLRRQAEVTGVKVPADIQKLSERLQREQEAGGDITQAAAYLQEAQDALAQGDLLEAKSRLGMAQAAAPTAVAENLRQERGSRKASAAKKAEATLRRKLLGAVNQYGDRAYELQDFLEADLSDENVRAAADIQFIKTIGRLGREDFTESQRDKDASKAKRDSDRAYNEQTEAARLMKRGTAASTRAREFVAKYKSRVPENVSRWAEAPPTNVMDAIEAETDLLNFSGEMAIEAIERSVELKQQKIEDKLEGIVIKAADLPEGAQAKILKKVREADALLEAGDLDGAARAATKAQIALKRAQDQDKAATRAFKRKNDFGVAHARAKSSIAKARKASSQRAAVAGGATDPEVFHALENELARATTPQEAKAVAAKANTLAAEANAATQEAKAQDVGATREATFEKAAADVRRRTAEFDNKFEELRKASPSKAEEFASAQERRREFERAFLAEGASDTDRTIAKKGIETEEANMREVLARAKPELMAYREERGRMARLGQSIALSRGVGALTGLAGSIAGGPQAVASQMVGAAGQLGGALQNYGVSKFVNSSAGFKSLGGWAAFGGGTVLSLLSAIGSAMYNRGSAVVSRGEATNEAFRKLLPSLHSKYRYMPEGPLYAEEFTLTDRLRAYAIQEGVAAKDALDATDAQLFKLTGIHPSKRWQTPAQELGLFPKDRGLAPSEIARREILARNAAAELSPGALREYLRAKTTKTLQDRYGNLVSQSDMAAAMSTSPIGRLGNVFRYAGVKPETLRGEPTKPDSWWDELIGTEESLKYRQRAAWADVTGMQGQITEAGHAARYAALRGRDPAAIAGISALAGRGAYKNLGGLKKGLGGFIELAALTGSSGLGFLGGARDEALTSIVKALESPVVSGYRADLLGDVRMVNSAAKRGADPLNVMGLIGEGGATAQRAASRYAGGFSNVLEVAADVMAYERSGTGDPGSVARERLAISESDKVRRATSDFGKDLVLWNLQSKGHSPEDAEAIIAGAFDASAEATPAHERPSYFDEVAQRAGFKNMSDYTASLAAKPLSDAEKEARAAEILDEAAASFSRSVDRFGTAIINGIFGR